MPFDAQSSEAVFAQAFVNPENGPASEDGASYDPNPDKKDFPSYKENVFYYTYDNVARVVLNSNYWYSPSLPHKTYLGGNLHGYIMDNQLKWLHKTLAQLEKDQDIDFVFITSHTPAFHAGSRGEFILSLPKEIPLGTPPIQEVNQFPVNLFLLEVQDIPLFKRDSRGEFILSLPKEIPLGTPTILKVRQMMTDLFYCAGLRHPAFQAGQSK